MIFDFTKYKKTNTYYGGSEKKFGISINNQEYMLKFRKYNSFGEKTNNHISEYIGSHVFELLGFNVQETYLGTYKNEEVVACKNFITSGYHFVPFNDVGESTSEQDKDKYQYSYDDIMKMLKDNSKLTNVNETIEVFWNMYVVDALLGNFDRHGSNWGFLKKDNEYKLAPIFDNGSCLFPRIVSEEMMINIMNSDEETNKRIYTLPTSQIKLDNQKSSYYDVISSMKYKECNDAIARLYSKFKQDKINSMIDDIDLISTVQKEFYIYMIKERFNKIIKNTYDKLKVKNYEKNSD